MTIKIDSILNVGMKVDPEAWTTSDILVKILEEAGEFSKATQIKAGKIRGEQPEDEDFDECADVMITTLDALARNNGIYDTDSAEIVERFYRKIQASIERKCIKWEGKIPLRSKYSK